MFNFNGVNKNEKVSRKTARAFLASLAVTVALSCGLSGCNWNNHNDENINNSDLLPDNAIESIYEEEEHDHDHEDFVIVDGDEDNNSNDDEHDSDSDKEDEDETKNNADEDEVKFVVPNIGDYDGVSLIDALKLAGYEYSFEYRSELAKYYGIENYRGTVEQNTYILNRLKAYARSLKNDENLNNGETAHTHSFVTTSVNYTDINDNTHTKVTISSCSGCGAETTQTRVSAHKYGAWKDNGDGTESRTCSDCGHVMTRKKQVAHEHKFVDGTPVYTNINGVTHDVVITSTCECGETKTLVKTLGHTFGPWVNNGDGTESRTCGDCGYVQTRNIQKPHIHNFTNPVVTYANINSATHDKVTTSTCECGETKTLVKTLGHTFGPWRNNGDGTESRTCGDCGYVYTRNIQRPHRHNFTQKDVRYSNLNDATHDMTVIYTCSCGETKVDTKTFAHHYTPWKDNGDGTESRTCGDCGYVQTRKKQDVHTHHYVDKAPVYTNKNDLTHDIVIVSECSCGDTKTLVKTIKHTYTPWKDNGDGTESRTCTECGHVMTRNIQKPHEHKYDTKVEYDNINDLTHDKIVTKTCSCGDTEKTETKNVPHTFGEWVDIGGGKEAQTCSECGHQIVRDKEVHKHNYVAGTPTYSNKTDTNHTKTVVYTCSCGDTKTDTIVEEHTFGEWVDIGGGKEAKTCSECGHQVVRDKEVHKHNYVAGTPTYSNKTDTNHTKTVVYTCSCGDTYTDTTVEEHTFGEWVDIGGGKEAKTCSECGHQVVRDKEVHKHNYVAGTPTYSDKTDTTHTKNVVYTCSCGDTYTDTTVENHTFGEWVDHGNGTHSHECTGCGLVVTEEIECQHEHTTRTYNPDTNQYVTVCDDCNLTLKVEDHTHTEGHWIYDADGEHLVCADDPSHIIRTESHNFVLDRDYYENSGDGHVYCRVYKCSHCGYEDISKGDVETHRMARTDQGSYGGSDPNNCWYEVYTCTDCGHTERKEHGHDLDEYDGIKFCNNCSYMDESTLTSTLNSQAATSSDATLSDGVTTNALDGVNGDPPTDGQTEGTTIADGEGVQDGTINQEGTSTEDTGKPIADTTEGEAEKSDGETVLEGTLESAGEEQAESGAEEAEKQDEQADSRLDEIRAEKETLEQAKKDLEALKEAESGEPVIEIDKKLIKE